MTLPSPSQLLGIPGYEKWYKSQDEVFSSLMDWYHSPVRFIGASIPTGCHAKGQRILMLDGTTKKVEDITVGDALMGPDSQVRFVADLIRGKGKMYRVSPVKGESFVINKDHILTLERTNEGMTNRRRYHAGEHIDVRLGDYLLWSRNKKHIYKLFRSSGVVFRSTNNNIPLDPYFLGLLLGDGIMGGAGIGICSPSKEVQAEFFYQADILGARNVRVQDVNRCPSLYMSGPLGGKYNGNPLKRILRSLGLGSVKAADKFVPLAYKIGTRDVRLSVLAGLMDTDGYLSENEYDYVSKSKQLADDITFMARSIGLAAYQSATIKSCQNDFRGIYFRVHISGDCSILPCRRRKAGARMQKKNVLRTGFSVDYVGEGDFYGFSLLGDPHYLLDDFTITHNSGKSLTSMLLAKMSGTRTVILTATKGLQDQYRKQFCDHPSLKAVTVRGQNNFKCTLVPTLRADEGPCHEGMSCSYARDGGCPYRAQLQTALNSDIVITNYAYYLAQTNFSSGLGEFGLIILDEGHLAFSALESYLTVYLPKMEVESQGVVFPNLPISETIIRVKKGDEPSPPDLWAQWQSWATCSLPIVQERVDNLEAEIKEIKESGSKSIPSSLAHAYRTAKSISAKLGSLSTASGDWIIQRAPHGFVFTPRWVASYSGSLFGKVPKVMLMSAILSRKTADYIGVPGTPEQLAWIEVPSHFPAQNTPIWHVPTARINFRTDDFGTTIWQARIDQIIDRRLDRKGIIFTVSYERARLLLSRSRFKNIMLTHSTGDVTYVVDRFKAMKPPAVLVSPSVTTGYDFPGNGQPQYIIIGKIPYPDTRDAVTQARHVDDKDWSSYMAMETLIQEAGRMSRSAEDRTEVFVVDDNWQWYYYRYKDFAPKWFRDRVKGSLVCVPDPLL